MSERLPDESDDRREEQTNRLAWFLVGAVVGATVGLLYAPNSGRNTRQILSQKSQESKDAVTGTSRDIVEAGREMFERGRQLVEDAADLFERGRKLVRG
ncbi:MAG TPA: YtxH domain-containing protein [Bryobacteraceae bacterium]|nr:YtxH domain-containing protein [Bryobacteraceae bacterium]